MKPTEILLDLNDLKLGRIIKKDFEEAVVDVSAKIVESPTKGAETLPVAPKFSETKGRETKFAETAPKSRETAIK